MNLYGYGNGDPINNSDPFGLMSCDPPGECPVKYVSLSVNVIFGAGPVLEFGEWSTSKQTGTFIKVGWGVGFDVNAGANRGSASSLDAFRGGGSGACVGLYIGNACETSNASGEGASVGGSVGPSEGSPVSGHAEASFTFIPTERNRNTPPIPPVQPDATSVAPPAQAPAPPPTPTVRSRP